MGLSITMAASLIKPLYDEFNRLTANRKQSDFNEFLTWILENGHEELLSKITGIQKTTIGIKALSVEQHNLVIEKLQLILQSNHDIVAQNNKIELAIGSSKNETLEELNYFKDQILEEINQQIPVELIDTHIVEELDKIRKLRFFGNFQLYEEATQLSERLISGDLVKGANSLKCKALAWCSRFQV